MAGAQSDTDPSEAVVGFLTADGEVTLLGCDGCAFRGMLCDVCIVPSIVTDPDLEPTKRPAA